MPLEKTKSILENILTSIKHKVVYLLGNLKEKSYIQQKIKKEMKKERKKIRLKDKLKGLQSSLVDKFIKCANSHSVGPEPPNAKLL